MNRLPVCIFVLASLLALSPSCRLFRRSRAPKAPPLVVTTLPERKPPEPAVLDPVPTPPEIAQRSVSSLPPPPVPAELPPAMPPASQKAKAARSGSRAEQESEPLEPQAPVAVPQLTHLLSAEERQKYSQEIEALLATTRRDLEQVAGRTLNEDRMLMLDRVRAFVRQAQDARTTDLVTALNLARRAQVLAEDLEQSTR